MSHGDQSWQLGYIVNSSLPFKVHTLSPVILLWGSQTPGKVEGLTQWTPRPAVLPSLTLCGTFQSKAQASTALQLAGR